MANQVSKGAALEYAEKLLGGPLNEVDSNPTVNTSVAIAVQGNGDRLGLVMINSGANDIMLALDSGVSSTNGIRLGANGGSVSMNVTQDFTLCTRAWYALSLLGASQLTVIELYRINLASEGGS